MKRILLSFSLLIFCFILPKMTPSVSGQNIEPRERLAVMNIDTRGIPSTDPVQVGNWARTEMERLNRYEVIDRYDIEYLFKNANVSVENCYGKQCLVDVGKKIKADKMMSGTVEAFGEHLVLTLKLIDVGSESVEKNQVMEFLNLRTQLPTIIQLAVKKMFDQPIEADLLTKLTKKFDYESTVNNPEAERLNLSGPRMGFTAFTGNTAEILRSANTKGGYDAMPFMFQFGYQFEVQYLNSGNFQALFEIIPLVTGLDQGKAFPSISILNGLRSNLGGWEFAFGPIFYLTTKSKGYFQNGEWIKATETTEPSIVLEERVDSRGNPAFDAAFVFALGKSFKSGKLNIPVNAFLIPSQSGLRAGLSFGFNAKK